MLHGFDNQQLPAAAGMTPSCAHAHRKTGGSLCGDQVPGADCLFLYARLSAGMGAGGEVPCRRGLEAAEASNGFPSVYLPKMKIREWRKRVIP